MILTSAKRQTNVFFCKWFKWQPKSDREIQRERERQRKKRKLTERFY